jgi:hypothetical protein
MLTAAMGTLQYYSITVVQKQGKARQNQKQRQKAKAARQKVR